MAEVNFAPQGQNTRTSKAGDTVAVREQYCGANSEPLPLRAERVNTNYRIMIVDDVAVNVKVLRAILETAGFSDLTSTTEARQALPILYRDQPDLLLLDIMMPEVSGLEILSTLRADQAFARLPVLVLTGSESRELKREALELGANDFLPKPIDAEDLVPRVRNSLLIKSYQDDLEAKVQQRTAELEVARHELLLSLARAAEFRDNETGNHVVRVGCFAGIIAEELGLEPSRVTMIAQAATLHDLGKIGMPDSILLKPGKLDTEEFEVIQKHCGYGRRICRPMSLDAMGNLTPHTTVGANILNGCTSPLMELAAAIALTHHEKWDGTGYPLGLEGQDIPLEGRITAVADVFDALTSKRPYKAAFSVQKSFAIMEEEREKHFDPTVLDAFFARKDDLVTVQIAHADSD
jgi:putative two-component system response regulator